MLRNYILTAYRNLLRNKAFSLINILGLSIGMAACLLIVQYITFERSYDRFHENYQNIYRVVNVRHYPIRVDESAGCVVSLGPALKETFPEVTEYARCYKRDRIFTVNNNSVHFTNVFSVDSTFLKIFSFPVIKGASEKTLIRPNTVVLTESAAKKLFGNEDPIGKNILQVETPYTVEAVVADPPANSHIKFDMLLSFITDLIDPNYCQTCNNRTTYIALAPQTDPVAFESKLQDIIPIIHPDQTMKREYKIQALASIHLNSHIRFEHEQNGNARSIMALTIVAALILFIAWLNYINLTTSMAINRAGEVGIRKVNGSTKRNLVVQFLVESLLVNLIAMALSVLLAQLAFPFFKDLTAIQTSFTLFSEPKFWAVFGGALIAGVLVYGFYPAVVISSFRPIQALKGKALLPKGVYRLRLGLVFLQFSLSIILVAGTLTVYQQISYMKDTDLGINIDQTIVVPVPVEYRNAEPFLNEITADQSIKSITYTSAIPGEESGNVGGGFHVGETAANEGIQVYTYYINKNYFDFLSIDFLSGKGLISDQLNNDVNTELVINDAACKALGFNSPDEALGKIIYHDNDVVGKIQGVVKDHHTRSLDNPILPMLYQFSLYKGYVLIRPAPNVSAAQSIAITKRAFEHNLANAPFEFYFLDAFFNQQYNTYTQFGKIFGIFTLLAIFTACLGLSGLSLYTIRVRTREIALRKVLGATVGNLLTMLSREYIKLTFVAFIASVPVAYYIIHEWLNNFPYHIEIRWWLFAAPGILVLVIALLTVSIQSLKTALANPTDGLRSE